MTRNGEILHKWWDFMTEFLHEFSLSKLSEFCLYLGIKKCLHSFRDIYTELWVDTKFPGERALTLCIDYLFWHHFRIFMQPSSVNCQDCCIRIIHPNLTVSTFVAKKLLPKVKFEIISCRLKWQSCFTSVLFRDRSYLFTIPSDLKTLQLINCNVA